MHPGSFRSCGKERWTSSVPTTVSSTCQDVNFVVVDLSGFGAIDEAGKERLREMSRNCAEFLLNEQSHRFHEILSVLRT